MRGFGDPDPPPPGKSKDIEFPSDTGPDPLKITKLPSQHLMLGHHRLASETPFIGQRWPLFHEEERAGCFT